MRFTVALFTAAALAVAGCGGGGRGLDATGEAPPEGLNPLIPQEDGSRLRVFDRPDPEDRSVLAASITDLRVETAAEGAILYASALAQRTGAYEAELRRVPSSDPAQLVYDFRVVYPAKGTPAGSEYQRTLRAAVSLTRDDLARTRSIIVRSAANQRETRR